MARFNTKIAAAESHLLAERKPAKEKKRRRKEVGKKEKEKNANV